MLKTALTIPALLLALLLALAPAPVRAQAPFVATDIAPVHALVAMVMRGVGAAPDLIMAPGASPHSYAMRPSQARALARADLVFWAGEGLSPWLSGPLENLAAKAEIIALPDAPGTTILPMRHGPGLTGTDAHGEPDPHSWLSPQNALVWLQLISDTLTRADAQNAAAYAANAASASAEITAAATAVKHQLAAAKGLKYLVYHDSFQYFEHYFDMPASGAVMSGHARQPGPARLIALRKIIAAQAVNCLLAAQPPAPGLITSLFDGAGTRIVVADPLGSSLTPGPGLYPALLRALGAAVAECL